MMRDMMMRDVDSVIKAAQIYISAALSRPCDGFLRYTFSKSLCYGNVPRDSRKSNFDDVFGSVLYIATASTTGAHAYFHQSLLKSEKVDS